MNPQLKVPPPEGVTVTCSVDPWCARPGSGVTVKVVVVETGVPAEAIGTATSATPITSAAAARVSKLRRITDPPLGLQGDHHSRKAPPVWTITTVRSLRCRAVCVRLHASWRIPNGLATPGPALSLWTKSSSAALHGKQQPLFE